MRFLLIIATSCITLTSLAQGSFAPDVDTPGTTAMHKDSSAFVAWASNCTTERGPQNITTIGSPIVSLGADLNATAKSGVNGTVSLGDGGSATLTFATPIKNETGNDFAVFENSFSNTFLELAFVEVSSDGVNFTRFPATSETQDTLQVGSFGNVDATYLYNLAGKYKAQYGTPFDLAELDGTLGLDINAITHIKIIDAIGTIDDTYASFDQYGIKVNDPYPTDFGSGGFDLDAVGVIHELPVAIAEHKQIINLFPNPAQANFNVTSNLGETLEIYDQLGVLVLQKELTETSTQITCEHLVRGVYMVQINGRVAKLILN